MIMTALDIQASPLEGHVGAQEARLGLGAWGLGISGHKPD